MDSREKAVQNKDKAARLNTAWGVGAVQARYSDDGHWYAALARFPAALFDRNGYLYFATEQEYRTAPLSIGKQISVPMPGISALPGYVRVGDSDPPALDAVDDISVAEGHELLRLHRSRERNRGLVARKKRRVLTQMGRLECEACGFDFAAVYGELGAGFAECHHTQPLAQAAGERRTALTDLAVVCANCHRMLHRRPWRTVSELSQLLRSLRAGNSAEPGAAADGAS
ncbi:MAG: HNH endonuclease [Pirellulales bacterium]